METTMEDSKDSDTAPSVLAIRGTPVVQSLQCLKFYVRRKSVKLFNRPQYIDGSAISSQNINISLMETTMEDSKDSDTTLVLAFPETPVRPRQCLKFYVRRKSIKLLNRPQDEPEEKRFILGDCGILGLKRTDDSETTQGAKNSKSSIKDDSQGVHEKKEENNSKENLEEKCHESTSHQDDAQSVHGKGKRKKSNGTSKKQRFNRPRILEEGKKPRNPATIRMRTISRKRKQKDKESQDDITVEPTIPEKHTVEPTTPEKQSFPKKRKNERAKRQVARSLAFDEEAVLSCLELSRNSGPCFTDRRKRMARVRRSDFHGLTSAKLYHMFTWKKQSRRSNRKKNLNGWARLALSFNCLVESLPLIASHQKDNGFLSEAHVSLPTEDTIMKWPCSVALNEDSACTKATMDITEPIIQQMSHQKDNAFSSTSDAPLQIIVVADTLIRHPTAVVKRQTKKVKLKTKKVKRQTKKDKVIAQHLLQQIIYLNDHGLLSLADVPLHIEDALMRSVSHVPSEGPIKKTKDIAKLIKAMSRLKIKEGITTMNKASKNLVVAKVNLDPETIKEWELLMVNDVPNRSYTDKETESKWKGEREIFQSRIDLFINRMHLLQGNRKFKQWKGSVVDSVVGVFLTQNVSDYLSSNAFMSVAAKFPVDAKEGFESLAYTVEEPPEVYNSMVDDDDITTSEDDSIAEVEEDEKIAKRKNGKTGIMEDETVDWKNLREMYTKETSRDQMHMDSVNWNDVRLSGQHVLANTIKQRGQHRVLARRIVKFLNDETKENGAGDLEWLRDAPSDLVKRYLLEIEGIGLKSAECVRLLGLKHSAFPVDTNVGRIAVRLGWVPLEPLADGVQMHQLFQYPSMDSIQKYLWPRLCKLPQETLYELHYQMITFGKVFCTKVIPNCNACPMKSDCKYFASAYVSSKVLLEGPEKNTHEPNADAYVDGNVYAGADANVDANMISKINLVEECASPGFTDQTISCEPVVEFPPSPRAETFELIDIEDFPWGSVHPEPYAKIPEIGMDLDALKKNVENTLLKRLTSRDEERSKALVVITSDNACIPIKTPRKMKYYDRLRTEHVVYVLPDNHELLHDFERREPDDPSPYLLAIWQPGETSYSSTPPRKKCNSDGSQLCVFKTCSYCWTIREQSSNIYRGTILIPCRTAMRGGFPLNGTYFQTNEVFADYKTSLRPIVFPRELCDGLEKRALYCGSSVTSIFRFLDTRRIQLCFWTGFLCLRAFDRVKRYPKELVRRLHTPPEGRGPKFMRDEDDDDF